MTKSSVAFKVWFVVAGGLVLLVGAGFIFAQTSGPTFYPSRQPSASEMIQTLPPVQSPLQPSWVPPYAPSYDIRSVPNPGIPTVSVLDDPTTLLPYYITSANQNGILPTACILGIMFIFQYVRSTQKTMIQREQFMQEQLNQSSQRTGHELSQSSMKLSELDMGLRAMQEQFRQQAELIHTSGQVCRDIVNVMAVHNEAVLQGMNELAEKVNRIDAKVSGKQRK